MVFNFGLIGLGRISDKHIEGIEKNEEANLYAICDKVEDKLNEKHENNPHAKAFLDYKKLLDDDNIDIVNIATESGYHAEIAKDCLNHGKHVIVEKPMALSLKDARDMIDLAEKNGLKLAVCHQNRFNPTIQNLKSAVDKGNFGKIIHGVASIRWNRNDDYYNMDDWHGTLKYDGGMLMNQGIHNLDIMRWMMGDIEYIRGDIQTSLRDIEIEDIAVGTVKFRNGSLGIIEGSTCIYPTNLEETFNLFGKEGTVRIGGIAMNKVIDWTFEKDSIKDAINSSYETDSVYGYGHNLLFKDVIDSIKEDRDPLVNGVEGMKAIELIFGLYKSSMEKKPIRFPIDNFSTLDMKE
ncbi:MAG: Gfo/Idh/MocA family protein [Candidatus Woesearchaeota archaeon]